MMFVFIFFKQKTAYEMRISDWSSDVCSSDLIGEVEVLAQVHEKVDDLGLDRDVQRSDGLVADQEARLHRQCAGNTDALALAARELMRVAAAEEIGRAHV